ncbi:hypothetical protein MUN82_12835 [Hymenobacter aerilatus]|uniref:Uncharacterized protein n=1 Tax=Hymenobacter aerilatus TaxID=2932251 RepID=A0A8T9SP51_9BACT|nr:hypothetical protein [Hymenobacter aerilatus]UOR03832.1 hypothetical protein MUN82_12835 [Hymenobacter aerilatus]
MKVALTFWQNYQLPLDGDIVPIVLPVDRCVPVLHDPFGWAVITKNEVYTAPNRFFAHATMGLYWKKVPHFLQTFTNPINSLYISNALFNTVTQTAILFLLASYVQLGVGRGRYRWGIWFAAAILMPLFQMVGYYLQIAIINHANTYTFFYAFPIMLLLVLFWPFYKAAYQQQPFRVQPWQALLLVLLMVVIAFNGPIAVAATAVLLLGIGVYWLQYQWHLKLNAEASRTLAAGWLSGQAIGLLLVLCLLCLYSLYIGRNEAEATVHTQHTLWELYQLLPLGLYVQTSGQLGLPLLVGLIVLNYQLVRWVVPASFDRTRVLYIIRGIGFFAIIFIILIPFGGYRNYRPYLIRNDSILPVTIGLFFAYGVSSYYLIIQLRSHIRRGYLVLIALVSVFYLYSDAVFQMPVNNDCERWALEQISQSADSIPHIYVSCNVLSWEPTTNPNNSKLIAEMLHYWGVTNTKKMYYQQ